VAGVLRSSSSFFASLPLLIIAPHRRPKRNQHTRGDLWIENAWGWGLLDHSAGPLGRDSSVDGIGRSQLSSAGSAAVALEEHQASGLEAAKGSKRQSERDSGSLLPCWHVLRAGRQGLRNGRTGRSLKFTFVSMVCRSLRLKA